MEQMKQRINLKNIYMVTPESRCMPVVGGVLVSRTRPNRFVILYGIPHVSKAPHRFS